MVCAYPEKGRNADEDDDITAAIAAQVLDLKQLTETLEQLGVDGEAGDVAGWHHAGTTSSEMLSAKTGATAQEGGGSERSINGRGLAAGVRRRLSDQL